MSDLHFYVDRLRAPYSEPVRQERTYDVDGTAYTIQCVSHTRHPSLLQQLREAAYAGIGGVGASALGSERIPLNDRAIQLYAAIVKEIGSRYAEAAGAQPSADLEPERVVGLWAAQVRNLVRDGDLPAEALDEARDTARGWVHRIEAHFNPPKQLELTVERHTTEIRRRVVHTLTGGHYEEDILVPTTRRIPAPCPQCGERIAYERGSGNQIFALLLEYQELGVARTVGRLRAACRACGYEWHGEDAARALMVAIDEKDRELQEAELEDDTPARNYARELATSG